VYIEIVVGSWLDKENLQAPKTAPLKSTHVFS